jgi:hypothetical protein
VTLSRVTSLDAGTALVPFPHTGGDTAKFTAARNHANAGTLVAAGPMFKNVGTTMQLFDLYGMSCAEIACQQGPKHWTVTITGVPEDNDIVGIQTSQGIYTFTYAAAPAIADTNFSYIVTTGVDAATSAAALAVKISKAFTWSPPVAGAVVTIPQRFGASGLIAVAEVLDPGVNNIAVAGPLPADESLALYYSATNASTGWLVVEQHSPVL